MVCWVFINSSRRFCCVWSTQSGLFRIFSQNPLLYDHYQKMLILVVMMISLIRPMVGRGKSSTYTVQLWVPSRPRRGRSASIRQSTWPSFVRPSRFLYDSPFVDTYYMYYYINYLSCWFYFVCWAEFSLLIFLRCGASSETLVGDVNPTPGSKTFVSYYQHL